MSSQFLPIYLINVDRATDRMAEVLRQSAALSIEINRVPGIDGLASPRDQWIDVDERKFLRQHGRRILPGEYGCYRSHLLALQRFLASGHEAAIVMEDDTRLDDRFLRRANSARAAMPGADVIKFVNHRWKGFITSRLSGEGDRLGRCLFGPQGSTACSLVTRSGAQKISNRLRIMSLPWDVAIERGWQTGTSIYSTRTDLAGFTQFRRKTMIGTRKTYLAAKLPPWQRVPAYLFRTIDFFRRLAYVVLQSQGPVAVPTAAAAVEAGDPPTHTTLDRRVG